ncbi:MAG: hypothetical protein U9Q99_02805 [Nanoarchaeota archaeon]|nr:hypothetical protein [Nanoarchaeota archaeon]
MSFNYEVDFSSIPKFYFSFCKFHFSIKNNSKNKEINREKLENILNSSSKFFEDSKNYEIQQSVLSLVYNLELKQQINVRLPSFFEQIAYKNK